MSYIKWVYGRTTAPARYYRGVRQTVKKLWISSKRSRRTASSEEPRSEDGRYIVCHGGIFNLDHFPLTGFDIKKNLM